MKRPLSTKTVGPETPGAWVWAKREAMLKLVPGMGDSCQRESAPPPCVYGGGWPSGGDIPDRINGLHFICLLLLKSGGLASVRTRAQRDCGNGLGMKEGWGAIMTGKKTSGPERCSWQAPILA